MVHTRFSALLQVFPLALTSFGSLALWMVPFHFKDHEVVLTLFTFEILKQCDQMAVAINNTRF